MNPNMGQIIGQIWELPWYKVLIVAMADDGILFLKLWPLWVGVIILSIIVFYTSRQTKEEGKKDG